MELSKLTKEDILAIKTSSDLLSNSKQEAKKRFHTLIKIWHPDAKTGDNETFLHIHNLYNNITNIYTTSPLIFLYNHRFVEACNCIKFADDKMEKEFKNVFPKIYKIEDGVIKLHSIENITKISNVLKILSKDAKHIAWIGSRLLSIACYLEYAGITHSAISIDTLWVDITNHTLHLLGGWEYSYSHKYGLPQKLVYPITKILPKKSIVTGQLLNMDLQLIKMLLKSLLDVCDDAPIEMLQFCNDMEQCSESAISNLISWKQCLQDSFGAPKFINVVI